MTGRTLATRPGSENEDDPARAHATATSAETLMTNRLIRNVAYASTRIGQRYQTATPLLLRLAIT
jgi:hypothetical protein